MKNTIIFAIVIFGIGGVFAFDSIQSNKLQQQQLADYDKQVQQLLTQVENNSLKRLEYEKEIQQLSSQLITTNSQLTALSNQLQASQQQINPDYQEIEAQIRQKVRNELQQETESRDSNSRIELIKQLSSLEPTELGELMSIQAQFGGFLQSLNVSDERMEVIVGALSDMVADQNQARMELAMSVRTQRGGSGASRREMGAQLRALSSPEAQLEALSFDLTEAELNALSAFQSEQQNSTRAFMANPAIGTLRSEMIFDASDAPNFIFQDGGVIVESIGVAPAIPAN